jgi:isovaleryl-CoA dehydrogenase
MLQRRLAGTLLQKQWGKQTSSIIHIGWRGQHTAEVQDNDAQEFRELVRDFASREIAPHAADIDRTNAFPQNVNLWTQLGHMGLHGERSCEVVCASVFDCSLLLALLRKKSKYAGITVPMEFGGLGLGYRQHCIAMEVRCTDEVLCEISVEVPLRFFELLQN